MPCVATRTGTKHLLTAVGVQPGKVASERCTEHVTVVPNEVAEHHEHVIRAGQCCSVAVQKISASVETVWSIVRRFDQPQTYKSFLKSCRLIDGEGGVGTVREIKVVSGLPAVTSRETLEILDDECHVISFRIVGGEHRLANYRSVTTLHTGTEDGGDTIVVESYVVDVPQGNTREETRVFVDTIIKCNLKSLERIAKSLPRCGGCANSAA